jgi:8-oxo-dGTP diphosphatase
MIARQFGRKEANKEYVPRPGAYAVIMDDRERFVAVIHNGEYFLPGGGLQENESQEDALKREITEETGYTADIGEKIGEANEYVYSPADETYYNRLGTFYFASTIGEPSHQAKRDHEFHWVTLDEFSPGTELTSHVWAVWQALRRRQNKPVRG